MDITANCTLIHRGSRWPSGAADINPGLCLASLSLPCLSSLSCLWMWSLSLSLFLCTMSPIRQETRADFSAITGWPVSSVARTEGFLSLSELNVNDTTAQGAPLMLGGHYAYWHSPRRRVQSDCIRLRRFICAHTDTWQWQRVDYFFFLRKPLSPHFVLCETQTRVLTLLLFAWTFHFVMGVFLHEADFIMNLVFVLHRAHCVSNFRGCLSHRLCFISLSFYLSPVSLVLPTHSQERQGFQCNDNPYIKHYYTDLLPLSRPEVEMRGVGVGGDSKMKGWRKRWQCDKKEKREVDDRGK